MNLAEKLFLNRVRRHLPGTPGEQFTLHRRNVFEVDEGFAGARVHRYVDSGRHGNGGDRKESVDGYNEPKNRFLEIPRTGKESGNQLLETGRQCTQDRDLESQDRRRFGVCRSGKRYGARQRLVMRLQTNLP